VDVTLALFQATLTNRLAAPFGIEKIILLLTLPLLELTLLEETVAPFVMAVRVFMA
jgi:hypothetical protein